MVPGLNNVQIIGNLGGTPEMKYLNNSDHVRLRHMCGSVVFK